MPATTQYVYRHNVAEKEKKIGRHSSTSTASQPTDNDRLKFRCECGVTQRYVHIEIAVLPAPRLDEKFVVNEVFFFARIL